VLPQNVSTDLPRAVEAIRKSGLDVFMITTAIKDAADPDTVNIVKTASALGIRHYRMGWFSYDATHSIDNNLRTFEVQMRSIAELNAKYGIVGEYQNHSGTYFGAPVWDLHKILHQINSPWLGSQYDILHATVESFNAWSLGYELLRPYIKSFDIKDFQWSDKSGKWALEVVPLGQGLIDYPRFFSMIKRDGLRVPMSVHYEFPLGGAEHGATTLTVNRDAVISAMKRDCEKLRSLMHDAQLR
jgi:L-ribulose-5-phosphate 3-epimerase